MMSNYFISKDNKSGEIIYLEYDKNGYMVKPKRNKKDTIEVNKIVFVSPSMTEKLLKKKIERKVDRLLYDLNSIDEDDSNSDEGNTILIRDKMIEAERLKNTIINNYKKYLGNSYVSLTLKKMEIIVEGYRMKLYSIKERNQNRLLFNLFNERMMSDNTKKGKGR